jgi:hypothetical protein
LIMRAVIRPLALLAVPLLLAAAAPLPVSVVADPLPGRTTRWDYASLDSHTHRLFTEAYLAPSVHVVAVDPATHLAYFPLKDVGGRSVLRVTTPHTE